MVVLDNDMGYGLMIWEMTLSIWSPSISIWHIVSICLQRFSLRVELSSLFCPENPRLEVAKVLWFRLTRYDLISIWDINMGDPSDVDSNIDMGYVLPTWDTLYRYGHLPYRRGHLPYRYGIRANDVGDDSIDTVFSHIDMGYLVTRLKLR
jgi:hypothetical protein